MKILRLLVLLMFVNAGWAQDGKWELGVNGGLGFSRLQDVRGAEEAKPLAGAFGGIVSRYQFAKHWRVEASLNYVNKGLDGFMKIWHFDQASGYSPEIFNNNYKLDYLVLPLNIQFVTTGKLRYYVGVGGYAGYLIKSSGTYVSYQQVLYSWNKDYPKQPMYKFDVGVSATSGFEYRINPGMNIGIGYQLQHGFTEVFKKSYEWGNHYNLTHAAVLTLTRKI